MKAEGQLSGVALYKRGWPRQGCQVGPFEVGCGVMVERLGSQSFFLLQREDFGVLLLTQALLGPTTADPEFLR